MTERVRIECADALELLRSLDDGSVQLVATDPPYFRVVGEPWDRQWDKPEAFLEWLGELADEWRRVLAPNGTLYCFASPQMAARVQAVIAERFAVLNEVVWIKPAPGLDINAGPSNAGRISTASLRSYYPNTERLIVAEQFGADGSALRGSGYAAATAELHAGVFEPLRAYLVAERDAAGITNRQVDEFLGTSGMAGHYFGASQWALPTAEVYERLRELFNAGSDQDEHLRREYEDLRREYEDLRREYEDLRRPFDVQATDAYTDVWPFATVSPASKGRVRHPCEKPLDMMRHIVKTSSRPGDLVLDCFAGSGTTAIAAMSLGRRFVGCDASEKWADYAWARVLAWEPGHDVYRPKAPTQDVTLFDFEEAS